MQWTCCSLPASAYGRAARAAVFAVDMPTRITDMCPQGRLVAFGPRPALAPPRVHLQEQRGDSSSWSLRHRTSKGTYSWRSGAHSRLRILGSRVHAAESRRATTAGWGGGRRDRHVVAQWHAKGGQVDIPGHHHNIGNYPGGIPTLSSRTPRRSAETSLRSSLSAVRSAECSGGTSTQETSGASRHLAASASLSAGTGL